MGIMKLRRHIERRRYASWECIYAQFFFVNLLLQVKIQDLLKPLEQAHARRDQLCMDFEKALDQLGKQRGSPSPLTPPRKGYPPTAFIQSLTPIRFFLFKPTLSSTRLELSHPEPNVPSKRSRRTTNGSKRTLAAVGVVVERTAPRTST